MYTNCFNYFLSAAKTRLGNNEAFRVLRTETLFSIGHSILALIISKIISLKRKKKQTKIGTTRLWIRPFWCSKWTGTDLLPYTLLRTFTGRCTLKFSTFPSYHNCRGNFADFPMDSVVSVWKLVSLYCLLLQWGCRPNSSKLKEI